MSTGEIIALVAVGLNALAYASGGFKMNATVQKLDSIVEKMERTLASIDKRIARTESDVRVLDSQLNFYKKQSALGEQ